MQYSPTSSKPFLIRVPFIRISCLPSLGSCLYHNGGPSFLFTLDFRLSSFDFCLLIMRKVLCLALMVSAHSTDIQAPQNFRGLLYFVNCPAYHAGCCDFLFGRIIAPRSVFVLCSLFFVLCSFHFSIFTFQFPNSAAKVLQLVWTNKTKRVQCWAKDNYSAQCCPKRSNHCSLRRSKLHFRTSLSTFHLANLLTRFANFLHDTDGYL